MANIQSKKKHIRQTEKRTERNRQVKSRIRTLSKSVQSAIATGDKDRIRGIVSSYISALDTAAKNKIIHKNKASRHKSVVTTQTAAVLAG